MDEERITYFYKSRDELLLFHGLHMGLTTHHVSHHLVIQSMAPVGQND